MPPRALSKNRGIAPSTDNGHGLEARRTSKQHQPSRFAREKPLSPRASQSLKIKDRIIRAENFIRPPYADVPLEFVKNANNGYSIQAKTSGCQSQSDRRWNSSSKEEELIRYMSKVPAYLHRGEKVEANVLNFGVLDWDRLQKWTHKQSQTSASCSSATSYLLIPSNVAETEDLVLKTERPSGSHNNSVDKVDFSQVTRPVKGMPINHLDKATSAKYLVGEKHGINGKYKARHKESVDLKSVQRILKDKKQETYKKDKYPIGDCEDLKSTKGKEKYLDQDSSFGTESLSSILSDCNPDVFKNSNKETSCADAEPQKCRVMLDGLGLHDPADHCFGDQESIVLLLPKDFSRPENAEVHQRASVSGQSTQDNWGSFSDIFSIGQIHPDESFSDIPHSCPLDYRAETAKDLDLKLDNLIKSQDVELPVNTLVVPSQSIEKLEATTSSNGEAFSGLDPCATRISDQMTGDRSTHQRFGFGIGRRTRSLSFKEGSVRPQLSTAYLTAKSGPANPEVSTSSESLKSIKVNTNGTSRASPLRRLLDPLLKSKVRNQMKEHPIDHKPISIHVPENENCEVLTIKALLHLTIKSGLPLFKFVVESNNEILASTVKSLNTFDQDDVSWLYTFYSVHKVRKKSGVWKSQKVKPCGFGYNVIGQMKVSKPYLPSWCEQNSGEGYIVKESVLYSVDVSNADAATSGLMTSRELAAIVANMPVETREDSSTFWEYYRHEGFSDFEDENLSNILVILPGGNHSLPHEGVPSSLINRWRTGGSCDCGGWDVGCKLRILKDGEQEPKVLRNSRSDSAQVRCNLYDLGEAKQIRPFFKLVPFRDGVFSVEFDAKISSLQAFSMCVAIINSKSPTLSLDANNQVELKEEFGRATECMVSLRRGPEIHAPHPPLSPVGRV